MTLRTRTAFEDLALDEDMYYPVPNGSRSAVLKLPKEMNRPDRRAILRAVERCEKHGVGHPYKGRMRD